MPSIKHLNRGRAVAKIRIRSARASDADALASILSDPLVQPQTLQLPFTSSERWRKRILEAAETGSSLMATIGEEIVGNIGLFPYPNGRRRHAGEIGMAVAAKHHGKGIGSALLAAALDIADNWLGLTRIELTVFTDNEPAIALYRKFGFEIEGTHRRYSMRSGVLADIYTMARLNPNAARRRNKTDKKLFK